MLQAFTVFAGRQMVVGNIFLAGDTPHITVSLTPLPVRKRRRKHRGTSHMPGSKRGRKHIASRRIIRRRRRTRRRLSTRRRRRRRRERKVRRPHGLA